MVRATLKLLALRKTPAGFLVSLPGFFVPFYRYIFL